jgi:hypothetical protein
VHRTDHDEEKRLEAVSGEIGQLGVIYRNPQEEDRERKHLEVAN